jgi:hypothetical protein
MHILMLIVAGLIALGLAVLIAHFVDKPASDGARVFIWLWLAASVINSGIGYFRYNIPLVNEVAAFAVIFGVPAAAAWYLVKRFTPTT